MRFLELIKENNKLSIGGPEFKFGILSNIMVSNCKDVFEYHIKYAKTNPRISFGDYDNIVQDSEKFKNQDAVVVFWEVCNFIESFESAIFSLTEKEIKDLIEKTKQEIQFVFKNLSKCSIVIFNLFSIEAFYPSGLPTRISALAYELNQHLKENAPRNTILIDLRDVYQNTSKKHCFEIKKYYSSKLLYSFEFFNSYAQIIIPYINAITGKTKKALILDCDNTLWKGIVGEDGLNGIKMSRNDPKGRFFYEVQLIILGLIKQGVILGICSKNNKEDVINVMENHRDFLLKKESFSIMEINWNNKASNLASIADKLNIGLDSLVMLDDSDFEVNLIKSETPEVCVYKVPEKLELYPNLMREITTIFYSPYKTKEDSRKALLYKQEDDRKKAKTSFNDINGYLTSLGLELHIFKNDNLSIERLSQLTQKTNQFNLTTKRYSEADIESFFSDQNSDVYSFSLKDKFGDYGITGLAIINKSTSFTEIDSLLMSCRVIGRQVEYVFLDYIITTLNSQGVKRVKAIYSKTIKNHQVESFYEKAGFECYESNTEKKLYSIEIKNYCPLKSSNIKLIANGK